MDYSCVSLLLNVDMDSLHVYIPYLFKKVMCGLLFWVLISAASYLGCELFEGTHCLTGVFWSMLITFSIRRVHIFV